MIKNDKRKFAICIAGGDARYYKHLDDKHLPFKDASAMGINKAKKEAQRLANKTGKKITVLESAYNVYPDREGAPK